MCVNQLSTSIKNTWDNKLKGKKYWFWLMASDASVHRARFHSLWAFGMASDHSGEHVVEQAAHLKLTRKQRKRKTIRIPQSPSKLTSNNLRPFTTPQALKFLPPPKSATQEQALITWAFGDIPDLNHSNLLSKWKLLIYQVSCTCLTTFLCIELDSKLAVMWVFSVIIILPT